MPASSTPLFDWLDQRSSGVLLHPTCLPGEFGVGTFGAEARQFVDFLGEAGFSYWQMCPLGPTSYGDSPYQCPSAFAGNPYLIDVLSLASEGVINEEKLGPLLFLPNEAVDYGGLYKVKVPVLSLAFEHFRRAKNMALPYGDFEEFKSRHASWLDSYALFQALKDHFSGKPWTAWPKSCSSFAEAAKSKLASELEIVVESRKFNQYLFFGQWAELRKYAKKRGVSIIGDIPIFAALDSADVWANAELFQFDTKKNVPLAVAGCPPDYFSADGQLWGNPVYNWDVLKESGYKWWLDRLKSSFDLYDVVRIDHFQGFDSYWSIPADAKTARNGSWQPGPGLDFFKAVKKAFPKARIIAEYLGELTDSVRKLRSDTGLPGMAILQFAFGGGSDNLYLPHNLEGNQVLYPGTHDNDTSHGWYQNADEQVRDHLRRYLRVNGAEVAWDFIRESYAAVSKLSVTGR
jgi:4-alpha-glucanotransferase